MANFSDSTPNLSPKILVKLGVFLFFTRLSWTWQAPLFVKSWNSETYPTLPKPNQLRLKMQLPNHVRKHKFYYTYVLQSIESGKWYIGVTQDLRNRFNEHQTNQGGWTKGKGPFKLVYYESCLNLEDAKAREIYLKTGMGRRYLKNRIRRFLFLTWPTKKNFTQ